MISRYFTSPNTSVLDLIEWETRRIVITHHETGKVILDQDAEVPKWWNESQARISVSKYFAGQPGTPERETSMKQVYTRVVNTMTAWVVSDKILETEEEASIFWDELMYLLITGRFAFNSPVWFNAGRADRLPQMSACFINAVDDNLDSILTLAKTEGMQFKSGSGAGTNWSRVRGADEYLTGGGVSSGMLSLHKGHDTFAGAIKSGGRTRRAAKLISLDIDHPEIENFIRFKSLEEEKAKILIAAGYSAGMDGEALASVSGQNANYSVAVSDSFLERVLDPQAAWDLTWRTDGRVCKSVNAKNLWRSIAEEAHHSGCPGLHFIDTMNKWNKVKSWSLIRGSNPCSEFLHPDDTSCNLGSFNLRKYQTQSGDLDHEALTRSVIITTLAMDAIVSNAYYPTENIAERTRATRPLGMGIMGWGAFCMVAGMPYDSDKARMVGALTMAVITGAAYYTSAKIAEKLGPFSAYDDKAMLPIMDMYESALKSIKDAPWLSAPTEPPAALYAAATSIWNAAVTNGQLYGFRNDETTAIAPTGTIAFLTKCEMSTGGEPLIGHQVIKTLVGGGTETMTSEDTTLALENLGYCEDEILTISRQLRETEGAIEKTDVRPDHLPIFDTAFQPKHGHRSIDPMGHVNMLAALQTFTSMGISKTVNLPNSATIEDFEKVYYQCWKLGVKCVAAYRDGSKAAQPLTTGSGAMPKQAEPVLVKLLSLRQSEAETANDVLDRLVSGYNKPAYESLPKPRIGLTYTIEIGQHKCYLTVNMNKDGQPREIFTRMAKEGSTLDGLLSSFAAMTSIALRSGASLDHIVDRFSHTKFEPAGYAGGDLGFVSSVVDAIARIIGGSVQKDLAVYQKFKQEPGAEMTAYQAVDRIIAQQTGEPCPRCGAMLRKVATCSQCDNCGVSAGCG